MMICEQCGHLNRCERCNNYTCERCGADLAAGSGAGSSGREGSGSAARGLRGDVVSWDRLRLEELRATLLRSLELCAAYERIPGKTRTTRELAWQMRRQTERALALLGTPQGRP